jgi:hypothetical protein
MDTLLGGSDKCPEAEEHLSQVEWKYCIEEWSDGVSGKAPRQPAAGELHTVFTCRGDEAIQK